MDHWCLLKSMWLQKIAQIEETGPQTYRGSRFGKGPILVGQETVAVAVLPKYARRACPRSTLWFAVDN